MTADPALSLRHVTYSYPRALALRQVSLDVAPGEVVAVTGRSGSGKSTLLHLAAGLITPHSGQVLLGGRDLAEAGAAGAAALRRRAIGVVLQHGQLVGDLTLLDNVALPLLLDGVPRAHARRTAQDWLERAGAGDLLAARPGEISGGQAQRAALARALVAGPALVLADEPTGSLDEAAGDAVLDLMLDSCRATGAALVVVTHDNRVSAVADREVHLADGEIRYELQLGGAPTAQADPAHEADPEVAR
ncbi:MAG: ATP-binding cassette domain-containing protein [Kineosporiaceae bacterium]